MWHFVSASLTAQQMHGVASSREVGKGPLSTAVPAGAPPCVTHTQLNLPAISMKYFTRTP